MKPKSEAHASACRCKVCAPIPHPVSGMRLTQEIREFQSKVEELVTKNPEKAAVILEHWLKLADKKSK